MKEEGIIEIITTIFFRFVSSFQEGCENVFFCSLLRPSDWHDDNQRNIYTIMKRLGRSSQESPSPVARRRFFFEAIKRVRIVQGTGLQQP